MPNEIIINGRSIGTGKKPYLIAELSGNHQGDIRRALKLVDAAADAGADAIKLQTYTADTMTLKVDRPEFMIDGGPWKGKSLYELYEEASTPWDWHEEIFAKAKNRNIDCFSSPFDASAVDFLDNLSVPAFKIASFEMVDLSLIKKAASKNKPIIMSTGIADFKEIQDACNVVKNYSSAGLALLHCISEYPANPSEMKLRTIPGLINSFNVPVGLSDHSLGCSVAIASIALGSAIVEKHITLERKSGGVDASFSLEPLEFKELVEKCNQVYEALGEKYDKKNLSKKSNHLYRRSIYVVKNIRKGEFFSEDNVRSIRPGLGLAPKYLENVLGKMASRSISRGEPLTWQMVIKE